MKLIKCDRCGKVDDGVRYGYFGIEPFYIGSIVQYLYSDVPKMDSIDLCRECNAELDQFVNKFMEKVMQKTEEAQ